ncbi:GNAT family N-acetyltransferase [Falsihalocynthiibacter sp. SS001]|uniref:GNAT family N-acetyltransferase n=1 Tax=Falsihalocynthiibacter sp. SS001 TaxID=3349698 RepID=UPI0036D2835A
MYGIERETPADSWEVEALYDLCFAPGREALSSYRLREGVPPIAVLSLVARDTDGIVAGAIRYWPVVVGGRNVLLLGPVAVHPTRQGEGLGDMLIRTSLDIAKDAGWERVMLVGDLPYYTRFGFEVLPDVVMPAPSNPLRVLGKSLVEDGWNGCTGDVCKIA